MNDNTRLRHTCEWCGVTFYTKRPDSRFHAAKCRQAALRWRKRLPALERRAIDVVDQIAGYLAYPDSRPLAAQQLSLIEIQIKEIRRIAGIRTVR